MLKLLLKFAIVGLSGTGINLLIYGYMLLNGAGYLLASGCSFVVAVTNNFIWNTLWTFKGRAREKGISRKYVSFFMISTMNLALNLLVLEFLVKYIQAGKFASQVVSIAAVSGLNFLLNHWVTFGEQNDKPEKRVPAYETDRYTHL
ncbi:hypothetical protein P22_0784 [Propionispora sp. 2/2-37]|uniref:GtrA family protein n=1 Tax=Propionispora sp. 2/2-37 TaxID=1677858 RepID=UPI0006BB858E|nr:GtrA family protein [Propionispora sp. 2/2-37]CUH94718.1 hypothetical protein P22_0784 [Propionispora sp. 2/2-37]